MNPYLALPVHTAFAFPIKRSLTQHVIFLTLILLNLSSIHWQELREQLLQG